MCSSTGTAMRELPASGLADLGDVLHNAKLPLTQWFWAAYLIDAGYFGGGTAAPAWAPPQ